MKIIKLFSTALFFVVIFSCSKKENSADVFFDSSFLSGKVDSIVNLGNNKYTVHISPSFEPVHDSPWFAFQVWTNSVDEKEIEVNLNYGKYNHPGS